MSVRFGERLAGLPVPELEDLDFLGWSVAGDRTAPLYTEGSEADFAAADGAVVTLYASWESAGDVMVVKQGQGDDGDHRDIRHRQGSSEVQDQGEGRLTDRTPLSQRMTWNWSRWTMY